MIEFNGILNNNGNEKNIRIFIIFDFGKPYITDGFLNKKKIKVKIKSDKMFIDDTEYYYKIILKNDEILIIGKEENDIIHYLMPCLFKPSFFVLTNKLEI